MPEAAATHSRKSERRTRLAARAIVSQRAPKAYMDRNALYGLFLEVQTWKEPKGPPPGEA